MPIPRGAQSVLEDNISYWLVGSVWLGSGPAGPPFRISYYLTPNGLRSIDIGFSFLIHSDSHLLPLGSAIPFYSKKNVVGGS